MLEGIYRRKVPGDKVITPELARYLTELSSEIGRQIGLLITRDGKITHVIVGDAKGVFIPGLEDFLPEEVRTSAKLLPLAEAIGQALIAAQEAGVSIKAVVADLEKDYHIPQNTYDVIICFNYLQRSLIPAMKQALKAGGIVVYETFLIDQAQWGKPKNPDYLLKYNELLVMFQDFRCLRYREGIFQDGADRRAIASIVAEKP